MLLLFLSSCNNFLHVEKRQYRKGLYVEKLFPFGEKKLKTSLSEDSLHNKKTQEKETVEDYLLSDNTVNTNPEILYEERDNIRFSTIKTAVQNPKEQTKEQKNSKPKIQDEDPDKEGERQKRDTLDTLIITFSILSIYFPLIIFIIPLTLAAFSIRRKRRGKSEKDKTWSLAITLLCIALFLGVTVSTIVFFITFEGVLVWYTFPVFLGLYTLLLLAIIFWPWPKYEKPIITKKNEEEGVKPDIHDILTVVFFFLSSASQYFFSPLFISTTIPIAFILYFLFTILSIFSFFKGYKKDKDQFWKYVAIACVIIAILNLGFTVISLLI